MQNTDSLALLTLIVAIVAVAFAGNYIGQREPRLPAALRIAAVLRRLARWVYGVSAGFEQGFYSMRDAISETDAGVTVRRDVQAEMDARKSAWESRRKAKRDKSTAALEAHQEAA